VQGFLNSITQNITIFIDEYEKIFGDSSAMLTIMDGALNSSYRRLFLLTTNQLHVDKNLIQRPSRIRYLKKFSDLKPAVIEEIVDDLLENKSFRSACIQFMSSLEVITVDIVKSVLNEVNMHNEQPSEFEDIFNVKKIKGKYNVIIKNDDSTVSELATSILLSPIPAFNEHNIGNHFYVDYQCIGVITKIINWTTFELSPILDQKGKEIGFSTPIILSVEDADQTNYTYIFDQHYSSKIEKPVKSSSPLMDLIKKGIMSNANDNTFDMIVDEPQVMRCENIEISDDRYLDGESIWEVESKQPL